MRPTSYFTMFRIRRYRVFIIFAVIAIGAFYHFTSLGELESAGAASVEGLKNFGQKIETSVPPPAAKPEVRDGQISQNPNATVPFDVVPISEFTGQSQVEPETAIPSETSAIVNKPEEPAKPSASNPSAALDNDAINLKGTSIETHIPPLDPISKSSNKTSKPVTGPADPIVDGGGARLEIIAETGIPKIHWSQMPEHFPVPTENLIHLPTGRPKIIPKIQHEFTAETTDEKAARLAKRDVIKKAFTFSWAGYKKKAWMQDELSPVSGKFRNPFCAWGATLVDSLDTLYMMDLEDEFQEAVEAVKEIDFTTSPRNDIPLFETVIRYLGGLVAAYDVSDGAHRILLDKAVELADILMGAFDTPNRMPMTFYLWKPTFASQPHRAKTRVVLAELGSLSVEFTRLAQITKEAKYYDAIARITNEFEDWQNNTRLPGLWPMKVDASGCKKPDASPHTVYGHTTVSGATESKPLGFPDTKVATSPKASGAASVKKPDNDDDDDNDNDGDVDNDEKPNKDDGKEQSNNDSIQKTVQKPVGEQGDLPTQTAQAPSKLATAIDATSNPQSTLSTGSTGALGRRDIEGAYPSHSDYSAASAVSKPPECEPQGLASPPFTSTEEFGIGGQADSTYEYLPKEYMLLGGLEDKYRTIYETSADVITQRLLYRTMIPDEKRRILHPGLAKVTDKSEGIEFKPEGSHLGCFAGGMYAVGAKIFGREDDMKIAKELTDGCVWAYESTATGIMPDGYLAVQCPDPVNCPWNETFYHEKLDPYGSMREQNRLAQQTSLLEADRDHVLEGNNETASQPQLSQATSTSGSGKSPSTDVTGVKNQDQSAQSQTAQGSRQSPEGTVGLTGAANSIFKAAEGNPEKPAPVPEQSAEHSASLPIGGVAAERPISPPSGSEAASSNAKVKRQLGETSNRPAAVDQTKPAKDTAGGSAIGVDSRSTVNKTTPNPGPVQLHENTPDPRRANSTGKEQEPLPQAAAYTPPAIPTHEEFVKARIKDERLPVGMTKVTGPRYLLR